MQSKNDQKRSHKIILIEHTIFTGGDVHSWSHLELSRAAEKKKKLKMAERGYSFSLTTFR